MRTKLEETGNVILLAAGGVLTLIGALIIMAPIDFYAMNNIEIGASVSLLNELKAPAGLLLAAGVYILSAIFVKQHAESALSLAALIYLSYAFSRLVSMVLDGVPAAGLLQAAALEGSVGMACLFALMLRRLPVWKLA